MGFTSFPFIIFFLIVVLLRASSERAARSKWLLLAISVCYYLSWSVPCVVLILFTSVVDYSIGRKLGQTTDPSTRKRLLITSVVLSLGSLGFFKYTNFLLENLGLALNALGLNLPPQHYDIILPPGISFYTFASLGYVLDVYYERIPACGSARDYTLFITFFPKLLSGPITRSSELLAQFQDRVRATAEDVEIGLSYALMGAVKKMVIADQIAPHVSLIFSSPTQYDGVTLLMGLLGYAVQIYCDFAGYSDMAIGFARILGFRLPENFQMPLSARSITDFWRRWHMTLSRWFRDYLFLPLEMVTRTNPYPNLRVSINIVLMMLLVGLWHGPSWNFVIFGGIHGLALMIHKLWTVWNPLKSIAKHALVKCVWWPCAHLLTLSVVLVAFVFFRAPTLPSATSYLYQLLSWNRSGISLDSPYILIAVIAVFLVHLVVNKDRNWALELSERTVSVRIVGYSTLLLLLVLLGATDSSPFIYFQF